MDKVQTGDADLLALAEALVLVGSSILRIGVADRIPPDIGVGINLVYDFLPSFGKSPLQYDEIKSNTATQPSFLRLYLLQYCSRPMGADGPTE